MHAAAQRRSPGGSASCRRTGPVGSHTAVGTSGAWQTLQAWTGAPRSRLPARAAPPPPGALLSRLVRLSRGQQAHRCDCRSAGLQQRNTGQEPSLPAAAWCQAADLPCALLRSMSGCARRSGCAGLGPAHAPVCRCAALRARQGGASVQHARSLPPACQPRWPCGVAGVSPVAAGAEASLKLLCTQAGAGRSLHLAAGCTHRGRGCEGRPAAAHGLGAAPSRACTSHSQRCPGGPWTRDPKSSPTTVGVEHATAAAAAAAAAAALERRQHRCRWDARPAQALERC